MRLTLKQVYKTYPGNVRSLNDINLDMDTKRVGILGNYGSGKTTLMNILATVTKPTKGLVQYNGSDFRESVDEFRSALGYLPQEFGVYGTLTAYEYLQYISALKGFDESSAEELITSALEKVRFPGANKVMMGSLSYGMRQRVGIAQLFLTDPKVILVDELSEDLSPQERKENLELLEEHTHNKLFIYASDVANDFQHLVDEILILSKGKVVLQTTPEEFLQGVENKVWELSMSNMTLSSVRKRFFITASEHTKDGIHIRCISETQPTPAAVSVPATLHDAYQHFLSEIIRIIQ